MERVPGRSPQSRRLELAWAVKAVDALSAGILR
jgi:hypothetical protein